ncbi:MAG: ABC transporter ATP-binding protein [Gammaproteobacteria bacterium]
MATHALLEADRISFAYNGRPVVEDVSVALRPGEFVGLVGPNGSGKTTLLRLLLSLLRPDSGEVRLQGDALRGLARSEIARRAAFVPQDTAIEFAFTVLEVVAMGRNPHLGRFQPPRPHDLEAIRAALHATGTEAFAERTVNALSGGERQRVVIARAIAQEGRVLVLDEPTANLDLARQLEILGLVRELVSTGRAAVAAIHDLSLAARYCGRIIMLSHGHVVADGPPEEVVTPANLSKYFGVRAEVRRDAESGLLVVIPRESEGTA